MNVIKENVEKDHQKLLFQLVPNIKQEIVMKLKIKEEMEFVMKVSIVEGNIKFSIIFLEEDIVLQKDNAKMFQKDQNYLVQIELIEIVMKI